MGRKQKQAKGNPALAITKRVEVPPGEGGSKAAVARFVVAWLRSFAHERGYTDAETEALVASARPSPMENGVVIVDCQTRLGTTLTVTAKVQQATESEAA